MKQIIILILQLLKRPYLMLRHNQVPLSSRVNSNVLLVNSKVGSYCYIGQGGVINACNISSYVSIAPYVQIGGMEHSYWAASTSTHLSDECISGNRTNIGNDVWIGANAVIKQGVTIGDGAVIGAGSVVTKDVPENTIVCGVPAKVLKKRHEDEVWNKIKTTRYWEYDKKEAKKIIASLK